MTFIPNLKLGFWNAWLFMSVFILQMLVIMFAGENIRKRSHEPPGLKRNRCEKYTAIVANLVWFTAMAYSFFLPLKFRTAWFYIGFTMFCFGLILLLISTFNFIKTPSDQLIKNGIYRISRHPMYLATFLICLGSGLAAGSWIFIFLTIVMVFCFNEEAKLEEKYCLNTFGDAYKNYLNGTPRWIGITKKDQT